MPSPRRGRAKRVERGDDAAVVARAPDLGEAGDLLVADLCVVDFAERDRRLVLEPVAVDADDHVLAAIDARLAQRRGLLDLELWACPSCTALVMPPAASTSAISAPAFSTSSAVSAST